MLSRLRAGPRGRRALSSIQPRIQDRLMLRIYVHTVSAGPTAHPPEGKQQPGNGLPIANPRDSQPTGCQRRSS